MKFANTYKIAELGWFPVFLDADTIPWIIKKTRETGVRPRFLGFSALRGSSAALLGGKIIMALFGLFGSSKKELSAPSSISRVVDENGEPQSKGYPPVALQFSDFLHRNYILATAIVVEYVEKEGVKIGNINIDPTLMLGPSIIGTLGNQEIHIYVRAANYPQQPILEPTVRRIVFKNDVQTYFAPVGLMPSGEDGFFFVNYRGCERL